MKFLFFSFLILCNSLLFSQAIATDPEFPTENSSVIITFDINQMTNNSLLGYTGTLYAHTGVYTNLNSSTWQYVIGSWGDNNVQPSLTRIGNDLYQLYIENPRSFYGLTDPSEHIISLNIVLRSSSASEQTEDLFVEIFEEGLNVKIIEPERLPVYPLVGQELRITGVTSGADSIALFINGQQIAFSTNDTASAVITVSGNGRQWIKSFVWSNNDLLTDSNYFFVRENLTVEELPDGALPGINYLNETTVLLALYAPYKEFAYLIGDFNDWQFDPDTSLSWEFDPNYYLKITPDSTIYWTTLTGLTNGKEYRYQYLVDGYLRIADPYADKILEEEDNFISEETYPDLIPYPSNKTRFSVSVLQPGQSAFVWEADNYQKPDKDKLIIYELLIRDFVAAHDYKTLIDTLDYLENLGINAIELMPVNEFEGNESWGYNPSFYFAPDKYYGPKDDLKRFIDECHKRNIAVIMDIVLNHSYGRSSFVRLYSSGDFGPPTIENPWYNVSSPNPVFSWGYDFDHESENTKKLIDRINRYWMEEYKFDGFRFDFTKGFTNTPGNGGGFDQSRIDILKRMSDKIWEYDSTAYVILEHFAPDEEEQILTDYGMLVWGNNNYNYIEASRGNNSNGQSNFSRISHLNHGFSNPHLVGYMESHDEERMMYRNLQAGLSFEDYRINELPTALNRIKLAAAFFLTVPGPKMIWQFGELGYDYSINYNGRVGNKPIRWDYYEDVNRKNLYKTFAALNYLKNNYEAFSTTDFNLSVANAIKGIKLNHDSMNVYIIGNFDVQARSPLATFQNSGIWYDYFSGDSILIESLQTTIELEPGEFHIYTTKKLSTPEKDILLDISTNDNIIPESFSLEQNYPNPFNPTTTIKYSIPVGVNSESAIVNMVVYDILGRKLKTLVNEIQTPGNYEVIFDAGKYASGVYYYQLKYGDYVQIKKMILLK